MVKTNASREFFDSLRSFSDIDRLIDSGEAENVILECKEVPLSSASINPGLQNQLAKVISAFSNTEGGVIIFGVKTNKKTNDELDYLTSISPIGNVSSFISRLKAVYPLLTDPLISPDFKILKKRGKNEGLVLMYISNTENDPVRSRKDDQFYIRIGETSPVMPYNQVKRMFLGSTGPDLSLKIVEDYIKRDEQGRWEIPITLDNKSNIPGTNITVSAEFGLSENVTSSTDFRDVSSINLGKKIFMNEVEGMVHRGLSVLIGRFYVKLPTRKRSVDIKFTIYAKKMRAVVQSSRVIFRIKSKSQTRIMSRDYLY